METKVHIRRKMLALREAIPVGEREEKSAEIMARVMGTLWYKEADIVLAYISYKSEVDTESLIQNAFAEGKKVYCPKVEGEEMNFYEIFSIQELEEGYRGIKEPPGKAERCFPRGQTDGKKCLMILPGSAFDEERNRIGYGKGYYDRFLERSGGRGQESNDKGYPLIRTIGVCFACQLQKEIPAEIHDKRVDMVITETDILG